MGDTNSTSEGRKLGNFAVTRENPRYAYYSFRQHITMRTQTYTRKEHGKTKYYKRNGYNVWLTEDGDEVMATELVKERDDERMRVIGKIVYKGNARSFNKSRHHRGRGWQLSLVWITWTCECRV